MWIPKYAGDISSVSLLSFKILSGAWLSEVCRFSAWIYGFKKSYEFKKSGEKLITIRWKILNGWLNAELLVSDQVPKKPFMDGCERT